jgi:hypothetical protein
MAERQAPFKTTWANQKETYEAGLRSLFAGKPEDTEADLSKLFTPTFTQTDGDGTRDFPQFVKHIRWLREILPPGGQTDLTIYQFVREGNQVADRHGGPDEKATKSETFMFGEVAEDGRVAWIKETVVRREGHPAKTPKYVGNVGA